MIPFEESILNLSFGVIEKINFSSLKTLTWKIARFNFNVFREIEELNFRHWLRPKFDGNDGTSDFLGFPVLGTDADDRDVDALQASRGNDDTAV